MSFAKQHGPLVVLNAAVLAGVAAWVAWLWPGSNVLAGGDASLPTAIEPLPSLKPTTYESLLARPLFAPGRRPVQIKVRPTVQEAMPVAVPAPRLLGIAGDESGLGALLIDSSGRRSHLIRPGAQFAGWTVVAVGSRVVKIKNGATVTELPLRQAANVSGPKDTTKDGR